MFVCRMIGALFLVLTLVGCGSVVGLTAQVEQPNTLSAAESDREQPSVDEEPQPTKVRVVFQCPEGWTSSFDAEQNQTVLRAPSGATIQFTIWLLEQNTPREIIFAIWEDAETEAEAGTPIEPGQPTTAEFDGVEATYMISVLTREDGQRITLMHVAFASNNPLYGILVRGVWPESENGLMLMMFRNIAQSIRISSE